MTQTGELSVKGMRLGMSPNRNYQAGVRFEREQQKVWEAKGQICLRTAGSHGAFDLVAIKPGFNVTLIQCKVVSTEAAADLIIKRFRSDPPIQPGAFHQQLAVKIRNKRVVSVTV